MGFLLYLATPELEWRRLSCPPEAAGEAGSSVYTELICAYAFFEAEGIVISNLIFFRTSLTVH